jgi:phosphoglycerate dehydrogenase-like enzyme
MTSPTRLNVLVDGLTLKAAQQEQLAAALPHCAISYVARSEADAHIADVDVYIGWDMRTERLAQATRLRWIQTFTAGVDGVDLKGCEARGIPVTNSSGIHAPNMAEHVMGLVLAFARCFSPLIRAQMAHHWREWELREQAFEVGGQTMLIIGHGKIGEALAQRAAAFGMRVIGARRRPERGGATAAHEVIGIDDLRARIGEADHVVSILPGGASTAGFIDAAMFKAMKRGAYFYNIGRGSAVDQDAMIASLQAGHLAGAGLDVTEPEPLPTDSPLWPMENVIITAHSSGSSPKLMERALPLWIENFRRFEAGEPLLNRVDYDLGY